MSQQIIVVGATQQLNYTDINCPDTRSQIFYFTTNGLGISINVMLFFIIRFNTTQALQQYSMILRMSCLIDIFSSLCQLLTQAVGFNKIFYWRKE